MSLPLQDSKLKGGCFCGNLAYEVQGKPVLSAYCHCTNCQRLTACVSDESYDRFILPDKPWKSRLRCRTCGVGVASYNIKTDRWSVWATHLERDSEGKIRHWEVIRPTDHIFYGTRLLDISDSLGKWAGYVETSERLA